MLQFNYISYLLAVLVKLGVPEANDQPLSLKLDSVNETQDLNGNGWIVRKTLKPSALKTPGKVLSIKGTGDNYVKVNLKAILGKEKFSELNLELVQIDPKQFSESLKFYTNLKKIRLVNVKLLPGITEWNFTRIYLPALEEFTLDLTIGFHDQYRDYLPDLTEQKLINMLFYDKTSQGGIAFTDLGKKLLNDGVQVTLRIDGWFVLVIRPLDEDNFDLMIALNFADKLLQTLNSALNVSSLAMTECSISKSNIPEGLSYLNFYRVTITDSDVGDAIKPLSKLTQLYLETKNGSLKFESLPKSIDTLAISDVLNAMYEPGDTSSAKTLGLGFPMDPDVIENFPNIFINLEKVGIFEPVDGMQHTIVQRVLQSTAKWIYMEGFQRKGEEAFQNRTETETSVEQLLTAMGVDPQAQQFLLTWDDATSTWSPQSLMIERKLQLRYRYEFLGWDRFISQSMYDFYFS
jgi:hypothetical protein